MLVRMMAPLMIPILAWDLLKPKKVQNPLHDGKRNLSGQKRVAYSELFDFPQIKETSRALGVTINDLMTSALAVAVKRIFEERQPKSEHQEMVMVLPANIRWGRFERWEDVELVNKFAPVDLTLPLRKEPEAALRAVVDATKKLKSLFGKVYASYIVSLCSGLLLPKVVNKMMVDRLSLQPTLSFSNVPGPLEKISYKGSETVCSYCAFIVSGRCGIGIGALSYSGQIAFTVCSDTAVLEDPHRLKDLMEQALHEYIEMGKQASQPEKHES